MNSDSKSTQSKKPTPRRSNRVLLTAYAKGSAQLTADSRLHVGRMFLNANRGDTGSGNQAQRNRRAAGFEAMKTVNSPLSRVSRFGW